MSWMAATIGTSIRRVRTLFKGVGKSNGYITRGHPNAIQEGQ